LEKKTHTGLELETTRVLYEIYYDQRIILIAKIDKRAKVYD